jgi:hypothetical protein
MEHMDGFARNIYLTGVGVAIAQMVESCQELVDESGITEESLREFGEYLNQFDAIGAITHPTEYRNMLYSGGLDKARKRVELVRTIFRLAQEA